MVGEFFRNIEKHQEFTYLEENIGKAKAVIHHKDSDRFNNDPRNLAYMNKADHILYHAAQKKTFWEDMTPEYRARMIGKISATAKDNWNNLTEQQRLLAMYNIRNAQKKSVWMRKNDPDTTASYKKNAGTARRRYIQDNPAFKQQLLKNLDNRVFLKNQPLNLTQDMLGIVVNIVKTQTKNKSKALSLCDQHSELLNLVKEANPRIAGLECKIDYSKWGYSKMDRLLANFGYKNWKTFVKTVDLYNHKIVSIETVESRDVGTITVDGQEKWHAHHTFAIDAGIFVKNSINEDFFFPFNGASGRGSSVDTLQGGQNLGEIDDLKYFNNKMARGLRVPSSYLPTGPDDSSQAMNDGRVGTALIQEYRFNQYCIRLQKLIMQKLDDEFKMFLRWRGFNIDAGLFGISLCEPQNFASYRQSELDTTRITAFTQLEAFPYMSKRFMLKRFLGLTEEEIVENESMWKEERDEPELTTTQGQDLRSIGITPAGMETDIATGEELAGQETAAATGEPQGAAAGIPTAGAPAGQGAPPVPTI
jgi:hypothetical protein